MNYKFVLVDTESGTDGQQWILSPPVTIGRCPTADITISDASISRKHCQFYLDPYGSLIVHDLGSKNGVFVDDRRVDKASVRPGAKIRIGVITLRTELTDEAMVEGPDDVPAPTYDLAETKPVKIIQPDEQVDDDDRYDLG